MADTETKDPGGSDKWSECQKNHTQAYCVQSIEVKDYFKKAKGTGGGGALPIEEQRKELHPTSPQKPGKQEESVVTYLKY